MTKTKNSPKPETVCTRFSRLDLDPKSVSGFIDWLCGMELILQGAYGESVEDALETMWGWNAPRHRMAKLLWLHVHGKADDFYFHQNFRMGTSSVPAVLRPHCAIRDQVGDSVEFVRIVWKEIECGLRGEEGSNYR